MNKSKLMMAWRNVELAQQRLEDAKENVQHVERLGIETGWDRVRRRMKALDKALATYDALSDYAVAA